VLDVLENENLIDNATVLGQRLLDGFRQSLNGIAGIRKIRGKGLMLGIELDRPCRELVDLALERGLLINVTAERVVRLLPPLVITAHQADMLIEQVTELIRDYLAE
jgi:acetylornithine aminotransferase